MDFRHKNCDIIYPIVSSIRVFVREGQVNLLYDFVIVYLYFVNVCSMYIVFIYNKLIYNEIVFLNKIK